MVRHAPATLSVPLTDAGAVQAALACRGVSVAVDRRVLVESLDCAFAAGEFVAVLGRNGSGKTLTLHTLAGLRAPAAGVVSLDERPIESLPRRAIARRLGLLPQDPESGMGATALECVLVGRHPHLEAWQWETAEDRRIAAEALVSVGLGGWDQRDTTTLSGGEYRRVAIATLLAQRPHVMLLDEPTNHLDPHHQLAVLELFRERTRAGATVVATLHDPTLAARYADRVLLLFGNGRWRIGPAGETLTAASLSELYGTPMREGVIDGRRVFFAA